MPRGEFDRTRLGAVVFSHPEALAKLEAITHPIIGKAIDTLIQRARHKVVVVEAIKLIEGQLAAQMDAIWVVDAPEDQQIERLAKRGLTQAEAVKRIRMQNPQAEKIAQASVVIHNNGTPDYVWAQVQAAWSRIQGSAEEEAVQSVVQHIEVKPVPAVPTQQAASTAVAAAPAKMVITSLDIVRGMPKNAAQIASLIQEGTGKSLTQNDVLMAFGQKSYMLAVANNELVGLVGFLVENLVTRVDEFLISRQAPVAPVATALVQAVERASRELQSEVGYLFMPQGEAQEAIQTFLQEGYERQELEEIKVPAWREAVRESRPDGTMIYAKKLRAERVLKPL